MNEDINRYLEYIHDTPEDFISPIIVTNLGNKVAQPICDKNIIDAISNYFKSQKRFRDYLIFILAINYGISTNELLSLKFSDFYDEKGIKPNISLFGHHNIQLNKLAIETLENHKANIEFFSLDKYVFASESNNHFGYPMSYEAIGNIFRQLKEELNLPYAITYGSLVQTYLLQFKNNCIYTQNNKSNNSDLIKNYSDIIEISEYLINNKRYRDNMLLVIGINTGVKLSSLRLMRFSDFMNPDGSFKEKYIININEDTSRYNISSAYITINKVIQESIILYQSYFKNTLPQIELDDYMFVGQSGNSSILNRIPLSRTAMSTLLDNFITETNINIQPSVHILRKTFLYHQLANNHKNPNVILFLQQMFKFKSIDLMFPYVNSTFNELTNKKEKCEGTAEMNILDIIEKTFEENSELNIDILQNLYDGINTTVSG